MENEKILQNSKNEMLQKLFNCENQQNKKRIHGGMRMKYQEDFVLKKEYLNLIEKQIYNTITGKFGMITGIEITGLGIYLKAYYDHMDSDATVLFGEFGKDMLQFVVITGSGLPKSMTEDYEKGVVEDIKLFFGEKFTEDMIMYIDEEKHREKNEENKETEVKNIMGKLMNLNKLSAEIFYDNYTTSELYKKYAKGNMTEKELLYGICNYLCEEVKSLKDRNFDLFVKEILKEQAEFLVDYAQDRLKKQEKIFKEENKEGMFKFMDLILKGDESESE